MKILAILAALFMICIVLCCGIGAFLGPTPSTSPSTSSTAATSPTTTASSSPNAGTGSSSNSEVDRLFAAQQKEYETQHQAWKNANDARSDAELELARIEKEVALLAKEKPTPPAFESREWATVVGNYKTEAVLVDTDNSTATLRKPDGKPVTVPKDKLIAESRIYIDKAFSQLSEYKKQFADWAERSTKLEAKRDAEDQRIASANKPEPQPPSREAIAAEVAEMNAKKREEQMAAKAEADRRAAAIAAAKAEEELDVNGLVLMRKTVSGSTGDFGGSITGVVVNRRSRKLNYAQITFNLYDESGAQVGSAMANINGLEPGGKWKFDANSFGKDFSTYKFSELTGF